MKSRPPGGGDEAIAAWRPSSRAIRGSCSEIYRPHRTRCFEKAWPRSANSAARTQPTVVKPEVDEQSARPLPAMLPSHASAYEHATSALYYLGRAFRELGRFAESQHVWRGLVCSSRYQILPLEGSSDGIKVEPLRQDHDAAFWQD